MNGVEINEMARQAMELNLKMRLFLEQADACAAVIPAKVGIHVDLSLKSNMDSRFRGNDGSKARSGWIARSVA